MKKIPITEIDNIAEVIKEKFCDCEDFEDRLNFEYGVFKVIYDNLKQYIDENKK